MAVVPAGWSWPDPPHSRSPNPWAAGRSVKNRVSGALPLDPEENKAGHCLLAPELLVDGSGNSPAGERHWGLGEGYWIAYGSHLVRGWLIGLARPEWVQM